MTLPEIPHNRPAITRRDVDAVVNVLESQCLTAGPEVERFEEEMAYAFAGNDRRALAVSSDSSSRPYFFMYSSECVPQYTRVG